MAIRHPIFKAVPYPARDRNQKRVMGQTFPNREFAKHLTSFDGRNFDK
jgi:hypothetical protein